MKFTQEDPSTLLRRARREPLFSASSEARKVSMPRPTLERLVPHRGPMLLLDEVTLVDRESGGLVARRTLKEEQIGFEGHFPGAPVYPGCLQMEAMGQLGLVICWFVGGGNENVPADAQPLSVRLTRLRDAFFLSEGRPGDELRIQARCIADDGMTISCIGQISIGDRILSGCAFDALYEREE
jgi:3-hydroxyacyl-[acyl-carrier-protein] dehydratase